MEEKLVKTVRKKYTTEEDNIIINYIISNPGNITKACDELAIQLNRSSRGISVRWYKLSHKKLNKSFITFGKNKHVCNRKNVNNLSKHNVSLWKIILNAITKKK